MDRHAQGVLLIVSSAVAFSSAGFFTRLIHLDVWSMLFWRGLFAGLMILCVIVAPERHRTIAAMKAAGRPGLVAANCSTAATILCINALRRTSVADVAVIFAAAPFLTAGLGWLWLGLTETSTTLAASLLALLGISIMVSAAAIEGHLFGDIRALGMTVCMAIMMLIIRRHETTPMLPAACLSALLCPLVLWPFSHPFDITPSDLINRFLFGTTKFGVGLLLLTMGGQMVSATENALPTAWKRRSRSPGCLFASATCQPPRIIGGIIVVTAVVAQLWYTNRVRVASPAT